MIEVVQYVCIGQEVDPMIRAVFHMGLVGGIPIYYAQTCLTPTKEPDNAHAKQPYRRLPMRLQ